MNQEVREAIEHARGIGAELENLIVRRSPFAVESERTLLIVGYWALVFDYDNSILTLLANDLYGGAFALLRPMIEAVLRGHVAISCRPGVLKSLRNDKYSVDFKSIGPHLDAKFNLQGFFERLLKRSEKMLHSFTHSGASQVSRRFDGGDVRPRFSKDEVTEVISSVTAMAFMVTVLTTRHLGFDEEWAAANRIFTTKAKHLKPSRHTRP